MKPYPFKSLRAAVFAVSLLSISPAVAAAPPDMEAGIAGMKTQWAQIQYEAAEGEREAQFASLAAKARVLTEAHVTRAEPHIWEGIILSSWGNAKGGLGALGIVKQAKAQFESAIAIDPKALNGVAFTRLALLYARVPGWPVGFGDKKVAEDLFKQALGINPGGIDANYFYAEFLMSTDRAAQAGPFLERASNAAPLPGQEIADAARRVEIRELINKLPS